jgi:hypothetical protein
VRSWVHGAEIGLLEFMGVVSGASVPCILQKTWVGYGARVCFMAP